MKTANNLLTKKTNFWLRMSGLAACLLVVLALSNPFGSSAQSATSDTDGGAESVLPETKIVASDGRAGSQLGAVGIDGNTLVLGAFGDTVGTNLSQGSAYIYVRSGAGWAFQQKLTASDGRNGDFFGRGVGISGDTVVIGASLADLGTTASNQGALYVFVRNSNNVWTEQAKLTASDASGGDILGEYVRMDGDTIIGAARGSDRTNPTQIDSGAAYVFVRNGTNWTQQAKLLANDGVGGDNFGMSADISGNTAVVGAWFDDQGVNNNQGSAYIFTRDSAGQWSQQTKLLASDGLAGDWFGISSAIDGETVVVGARQDNHNPGTPGSGSGQGSAYVYVRNGAAWTQQQKITATGAAGADTFGESAAILGDRLVIGAFNVQGRGAVYPFKRNGTTWTQEGRLMASDGATNDFFSDFVALGRDEIVASSYGDDIGTNSDQGSVYVYSFSPNTPTGNNVTVQTPTGDARVTFAQVTTEGTTTFTPITPPSSAGTPPSGYTILASGPAYDITTTAVYTPPVTVCFTVSSISNAAVFARVRILHGESGQLVDRTILAPDSPAPDFATRSVCARVNSLSPFVTALAPGAPAACTAPPSGIVAWLPGDGNANDISGNNNNGTLLNGTTFAAGKVAQTFSFDGVDDRVQLGNPTSLQLQDFTIETWIKRSSASLATNNPDANNPGGIFLAYGGGGYGFFIDQPTNRLGLTHVGFSAAFSTATITDTNYHHVAVTKNGSTVTFYIDGVAGASVSYNPTFTFTTDAAIGARGDGVAQNAFFGNIDELSVYNRTLSQTEIQSIVDADSAGKCKPGAPTPGTLQFSAATYTVGENGAMATLTVTRTGGSDGLVSVDYTPGGGTASGGASCGGTVDYVNTGGTILFADGITSQTFDVPICNDNLFEGDETFNATLSNATGGASIGTTNPAAVTITDKESPPLNTPPAANNDAATVAENSGATPIDVLANDTDADGDTLTITVVTNGANGSVAITGGGTSVTYTPNPNFSGADSFTYTISDGNGGTATATVNITVTPVNDPPIITAATAISRQRGAAGSVSTIAGVSDAEDAAGSLTVTVTSVPTGISVTGITNTNGTITANVTANCSAAIGANTVGLKVTDSNGAMATANLTVNVTQETTPPVINPIANVVVNLPANSNATSMVVNFPTPTASDNCGGAVTVTTNPASGSTFPVGTTTVTVTATDSSGNVAMSSFTVSVRFRYEFRFDTFFSPYRVIRLNPVEAGSNVTVIFSLSGFKGYDIYSAPPASQRINCSTGNPMGAIQPIQTTVSADPLYNAGFDRYSTTWRTQAVWAGTCRRLILSLKDGTTQTMDFQFR